MAETEPTPAVSETEAPAPVVEEAFETTPVAALPVEEIPAQAAAEAVAPAAPSPDEMDLDAAFAWLELLAARQGAEPETLSVPASDRQEQPPAWVEQAAAEARAAQAVEPAAELPTVFEETTPAEPAIEPSLSAEPAAEAEIPAAMPAAPEMPAAEIPLAETPVEEPVEEEPLPDWLKSLETPAAEMPSAPSAVSGESVSTWLKNVQVPEEETPAAIPEEPVAETPVEPLPDWLQGLELVAETPVEAPAPEKEPAEGELPAWLQEAELAAPETAAEPVDEGLPEWLQGLDTSTETVEPEIIPLEPAAEEILPTLEVPLQPEEVLPSAPVEEPALVSELPQEQPVEFTPAEETLPVAETVPEVAASLEQPEVTAEIPVAPVEEIPQPVESLAPEEKPAEEVPAAPAIDHSKVFAEAQGNLDEGNIEQAREKYGKLIESQVFLEEIIRDLQNALYRSPVDVGLHETLGDAFAKSNRLQEALDTYTKAEELLVK